MIETQKVKKNTQVLHQFELLSNNILLYKKEQQYKYLLSMMQGRLKNPSSIEPFYRVYTNDKTVFAVSACHDRDF